jgi:dTDP-4-amino-4,6-dideoxygalactose transaminase
MYVSPWPGLTFRDFMPARRKRGVPYPFSEARRSSFVVARSGIYQLFRALRFQPGETVLVPDYYSGNEVAAIRAAGASIVFYPIRRNLEPDMEALTRLAECGPRVIYAIHYLGWPQPMDEFQALCARHGSLLVEDCALSLFSETEGKPLGAFGDYSVFCLYKTLPVPNGGVLVQNRGALAGLEGLELEECPRISAAGRTAELVLETLRSRCEWAGRMLFTLKQSVGRKLRATSVRQVSVGDIGWDIGNVNLAMSKISRSLLHGIDHARIRRIRRENFSRLQSKLAGRVKMLREDLGPGVCPLFFPILVANKHEVAEALRARGIEAVEFWNDLQNNPHVGPDARYLRAHVLELPIHQGVTPAQVDYIAEQVESLRPEPAPC